MVEVDVVWMLFSVFTLCLKSKLVCLCYYSQCCVTMNLSCILCPTMLVAFTVSFLHAQRDYEVSQLLDFSSFTIFLLLSNSSS